MTSTNHKPFDLDVEAFSLRDGETSIYFEADPDLSVGVARALGNQPGKPIASQAALVLVELGIDGDKSHKVRVMRTGNFPGPDDDPSLYEDAFNYPHQNAPAFILGDAVEALQAVLDQLLTMRTVAEARTSERNAFELGAAITTEEVRAADRCRCGMAADAMVHNAERNGHTFEG